MSNDYTTDLSEVNDFSIKDTTDQLPFTIIPNFLITEKTLSSDTKLTIMYIFSKKNIRTWIARKYDIMSQLGITEHGWRKVSKELKEHGYLTNKPDHTGTQLVFSYPWLEKLYSPSAPTTCRKPTCGKSTPIENKEDIKQRENSNNPEPVPPKFKHQAALAAGDAVVAQILEKAAAYELPSKPIQKLVKKYGRGKVEAALDLLAKKENVDTIKNLMGWVTEAVKEDWVEEETAAAAIPAPKPVNPSIEAQRYLTEHRGTKRHTGALLALAAEGIREPVYADYKGQEYEIFFNDECKFNIKLVEKMKELSDGGEKQ